MPSAPVPPKAAEAAVQAGKEQQVEKKQTDSIQEEKEQKEKRKEQLENIVSVSEDGDTVQVSEKGQAELEDKEHVRVVADSETRQENYAVKQENFDVSADVKKAAADDKDEEAKKAGIVQEDDDEDKPAASKKIMSFSGYTDAQVEQLYRKGEISRYDYEKEMTKREEQLEKKLETGHAFSEEMSENIQTQETAERRSNAVEMAYAADASDTLSPQTRVDAVLQMEELGQEQQEEQRFQVQFS